MKKSMQQWLDEYGESHQNPINKLIHWLCVPIITFTLLGLLSLITFEFNSDNMWFKINLASILVIISIIFYIRLSIPITIGMIFFSGTCIYFIQIFENSYDKSILLKYYLIVFVLAWIGQFIGHKIEGKKPSFIKDIQFLLIGPAWLLSFIYKKINIKI